MPLEPIVAPMISALVLFSKGASTVSGEIPLDLTLKD
jgi:hypothetical protein